MLAGLLSIPSKQPVNNSARRVRRAIIWPGCCTNWLTIRSTNSKRHLDSIQAVRVADMHTQLPALASLALYDLQPASHGHHQPKP